MLWLIFIFGKLFQNSNCPDGGIGIHTRLRGVVRQDVRVQIPLGALGFLKTPILKSFKDNIELSFQFYFQKGRLAQLVRASGLHPEGRRFDSYSVH